jgi:hypothetical protein
MLLLRRNVLFLVAIAIWCVPSSAWAGNLLLNGGFDTPTPGLSPPNYPTSISGAGASGFSSAGDWTLFNGQPITTSSELLPTTDPINPNNPFMIHVTSVPTTGNFTAFSGLEQGFATQVGVPVTASVDVDVLQGSILLGIYANNGGTLLNFITTNILGWQTLTVTQPASTDPNSEPNLIVIYSDNFAANATNEFYADNAVLSASVPEPSTGLLTLIGMSATALWVRSSRSRRGRHQAGLAI